MGSSHRTASVAPPSRRQLPARCRRYGERTVEIVCAHYTSRRVPMANDSVLRRSPFCASHLCFELGHVQDDDFAAFQTNDASVNKTPEVAGNQITDRANLRADLLVGFFQGKL